MASPPSPGPAGKAPAPEKKAPALPAGGSKPADSGKPERPIADVDRKVRGGDA